MPINTYDENGAELAPSDLWAVGRVKPGSSLEDDSIASGIPAASLDIFYDSDDPTRHRGTDRDLPLAPESYDGR